MSYYPRSGGGGHNGVQDFDDFDPTPYSGGYDINLTYGRPLSASRDTCYPPASSSSTSSSSSLGAHAHAHAQGYGGSRPSAYSSLAGDNDRINNHYSPVHVVGGLTPEDGGYRRKNEKQQPDGYGQKKHDHDDDDHDNRPAGYGRKKHDDDDDNDEGGRHDNPTRYARKKHDDDEGSHHDKPSRYGRNKHGDDEDSSDEDEKRQRRRGGRQHKSYDDE